MQGLLVDDLIQGELAISKYREGGMPLPPGLRQPFDISQVPAEFLGINVWHPLILAILLHSVVLHP